MNLIEIKDIVCPDCGAVTVSETLGRFHTNGHGFEIRKFKCGKELSFIPNFMRVEESKKCTKSKDANIRRESRMEAYRKLTNYINNMKVDKEWKDKAQSDIKYLEYWSNN